MARMERYYTPEQLEQLNARRRELGPDGMERAQRDWAETIAALQAHMEHGTDPADPEVQAIIRRWDGLVEQFTGGDAGIRASLQKRYDEQGPTAASHGMVDPALMEYAARARDATA
jgi:hypothetical protein